MEGELAFLFNLFLSDVQLLLLLFIFFNAGSGTDPAYSLIYF